MMAIANGTCISFCNQPKAHFGLLWVRPGTIAVNVNGKMERGFNAGQKHSSIIPIYLQPFTSYIEIFVGNCNFFLINTPLAFNAPVGGCFHWNSGKKFGPQKTRIMGLPGSEDSLTID